MNMRAEIKAKMCRTESKFKTCLVCCLQQHSQNCHSILHRHQPPLLIYLLLHFLSQFFSPALEECGGVSGVHCVQCTHRFTVENA